ncbi:MAG: SPASM domain-containing protein [Planctomycetaceae bacterium]|nr:SPASM domain-containing protein [Planctomycetaceae bacterium]
MGCAYCYAEQGTFGGRSDNMSVVMAKAAVDRLFKDAPRNQTITLAFMGGEPLFNRQTLHETTVYAAEKSVSEKREVAFTMTTNATLIRPEDVELFQRYRFHLTISIDGIGESNDALRPDRSGRGTYERVKEKLQVLFAVPQRVFQVSARVTVTPRNINLTDTFRGLLELGFDSIQFSPLLKSPGSQDEMSVNDFDVLLQELVACGELFREGFRNRQLLPLLNVLNTLKRIHDYQPENYPCGAGGGYMGVSADGNLYACHRFVGDEVGHLGNVTSGVFAEAQEHWLTDRHLNAQGACNSCWARNLCSGSCHYEVIRRGRPACDYIRGWIYYCLMLYVDLLETDSTALTLLLGNSDRNHGDVAKNDGTGIGY